MPNEQAPNVVSNETPIIQAAARLEGAIHRWGRDGPADAESDEVIVARANLNAIIEREVIRAGIANLHLYVNGK